MPASEPRRRALPAAAVVPLYGVQPTGRLPGAPSGGSPRDARWRLLDVRPSRRFVTLPSLRNTRLCAWTGASVDWRVLNAFVKKTFDAALSNYRRHYRSSVLRKLTPAWLGTDQAGAALRSFITSSDKTVRWVMSSGQPGIPRRRPHPLQNVE